MPDNPPAPRLTTRGRIQTEAPAAIRRNRDLILAAGSFLLGFFLGTVR